MDWLLAVDIYCERTSPAFWAEPITTLMIGLLLQVLIRSPVKNPLKTA